MPGFDNNTVYATNVDFSGSANVSPQVVADGQLLIGSTISPNIKVGTLSSTDSTIGITNGSGTIDLKTNSATKITTYLTNDTWNKDSRTKFIEVYMISGGGSGASGRQATSTTSGGGGGGGGGNIYILNGPATSFPNSAAIVVAQQISGGSGQTNINTDGINGSNGNNSSFASIICPGGSLGRGGTITSGLGGGTAVSRASLAINFPIGGEGGDGRTVAGNNAQTNVPNNSGGGGGGGGADSVTIRSGGNSSDITDTFSGGTVLISHVSGGIESGIIDGHIGNNATNTTCCITTGTGGGGGGGQSAGPIAGNGGNGGFPGGGGGGGGGSLNGTTSGAGGAGAAGQVIVIEYF